MSTLERKLKEAFDSVLMPQEVKADTLDFLEEEARKSSDTGFFSSEKHTEAQKGQAPASAPAPQPFEPVVVSGGQKVSTKKHFSKSLQRLAVAVCFLLVVVGFGGFNAYATETALVGIDLNPSIELGVNRFDTVVAARALNEEGQKVLDSVAVTGKNYDEALALITNSDTFLSYIEGEEDFVGVTVLCDDQRQAEGLVQRSQSNLEALPCESVSAQTSEDVWSAAQEAGMGVGRYEAAVALTELDSSITVDDCHSMKMSELRNRIATIDPDHEYASHSGGQHHGQGSGQGSGAQDGSGQGNSSGNQGSGSGNNGSGSSQNGGNGSRHGQEHN